MAPRDSASSGDSSSRLSSKLSTSLGVAKDALPVASSIAGFGFSVGRWGTDLGFRIGRTCMNGASGGMVVGGVALGVAGLVSAPVVGGVVVAAGALKLAEKGVGAAHTITLGGIDAGCAVTTGAIDGATYALDRAGVQDGTAVRLMFGPEAGDAMIFIKRMVCDFTGGMPQDMDIKSISTSARALARLQAAVWCPPGSQLAGHALTMPEDVVDVPRYMRFALACYGHLALKVLGVDCPMDDKAAIGNLTGINPESDMLYFDWSGEMYRPGYFLSVDHARRSVVLAFRGTMRTQDVLTDLVCEHTELDAFGIHGTAHRGMLEAARRFSADHRDEVLAALRAHASYDLVLCGHSLGAGMATLLAVLWGPQVPVASGDERSLRCFAYAPPCTLTLSLSRAVAPFITSVINGKDMVPRFGLAASKNLRAAIIALHREGLSDRIIARFDGVQLEGDLAGEASDTVRVPTLIDEADKEWARSIMSWLRTESMVEEVMFPPGRVLWGPPGLSQATEVASGAMHPVHELVLCPDAASFGELQLCSSMFSAHMPQAYARLLG